MPMRAEPSRSLVAATDLWELALQRQAIDPAELMAAVERQLRIGDPDFRTSLLIRDAVRALTQVQGREAVAQWLAESPARREIESVLARDLGRPGFSSLARRLMKHFKPESALQFLRELGSRLQQPSQLIVGESMALILTGHLQRRTEDIDVVDELPPAVRSEHELLDALHGRYDLRLTHFQSHYLPTGWDQRLRSLGRFGKLDVLLVDAGDIFIGKLFSRREKDRDDLRALAGRLDKAGLIERLHHSAKRFIAEPALRNSAEQNWYILYGEPLPA